ncbi:MAG: shikimate kinase, partial [Bacteroidales bacterium]|nr:shikimate kinase [Bacteroidales bacterium]
MNKVNRIFLMGFMGVGKTTLGRRLAKQLSYQFIDLDLFIQQKQSCTISELFADGEEYFRKIETEALRELASRTNVVISLGGGTPAYNDNMAIISRSFSIYIYLPESAIFQRLIASRNPRPLIKGLNHDELKAFISNKLKEREVFYRQANITVDGHRPQLSSIVSAMESLT